jgi:hypothetical protein
MNGLTNDAYGMNAELILKFALVAAVLAALAAGVASLGGF